MTWTPEQRALYERHPSPYCNRTTLPRWRLQTPQGLQDAIRAYFHGYATKEQHDLVDEWMWRKWMGWA